MRGLKHKTITLNGVRQHVASFTDAWIETNGGYDYTLRLESHLLQMRGLKPIIVKDFETGIVASFTDAWIETIRNIFNSLSVCVASFTDAWIETHKHHNRLLRQRSHLLQMRGLKQVNGMLLVVEVVSHLLQMRGLKLSLLLDGSWQVRRIFYRCVD